MSNQVYVNANISARAYSFYSSVLFINQGRNPSIILNLIPRKIDQFKSLVYVFFAFVSRCSFNPDIRQTV